MRFSTTAQVRFAHVDAAGIVFYPRYFELLNGAVEDWFAALGSDFRTLHLGQNTGTPTVSLECEFVAPSMLGDLLQIELNPEQVGTSSLRYGFRMVGEGRERVRGSAILVCMDLAAKQSRPWPGTLRDRLNAGLPGEAAKP